MDKPLLLVEDCDAVQLDGCVLHGSHPPLQQAWQRAQVAMQVNASRVWCTSGTFLGGQGFDSYGGDAIRVAAGSFLHLTRTSVVGGNGGAHFGFYWWDIYGFPGEEAIDVTASQVVIAGGPDNLCIGGSGVLLGTNDWTAGGAAVRLRVNGSVRYADDAELERGLDGDGGAYGPLVFYALGTTGVVEIAEQAIRPTLAVLSPTAAPGQVLAVDASGDAGALHFVFASSKALLPIALPGTGMHVHADPGSALIVVPLLLDAIGSGGFAVPLPANPALAGVELILQSIDGDLSTLRVSNPALFTITP
jgi:hypothetical protein